MPQVSLHEISLRHLPEPDETFSFSIPEESAQNLLDDDDFLLGSNDSFSTPAVNRVVHEPLRLSELTPRRPAEVSLEPEAPLLLTASAIVEPRDSGSSSREAFDARSTGSILVSTKKMPVETDCSMQSHESRTNGVVRASKDATHAVQRPANLTAKPKERKTLSKPVVTSSMAPVTSRVPQLPPIGRDPIDSCPAPKRPNPALSNVNNDALPDRLLPSQQKSDLLNSGDLRNNDILPEASFQVSSAPGQSATTANDEPLTLSLVTPHNTSAVAVSDEQPVGCSKASSSVRPILSELDNESARRPRSVGNNMDVRSSRVYNEATTSGSRRNLEPLPRPRPLRSSSNPSSSRSSSRHRSVSSSRTEQSGKAGSKGKVPLTNSSTNSNRFDSQMSRQIEAQGTDMRKRSMRQSKLHPIPDYKAQHAVHDGVMVRRKEKIVPVVPIAMAFSTEERAKERAKFDEKVKERERELERAREESRRQREEEEEREIKELRRKAVPKAHVVPDWYKDAPKRQGKTHRPGD